MSLLFSRSGSGDRQLRGREGRVWVRWRYVAIARYVGHGHLAWLATCLRTGRVLSGAHIGAEWLPDIGPAEMEGVRMAFVRKVERLDQGSQGPADLGGGEFGLAHPAVWEYLSLGAYADGTERLTATLLAFVEDAVVKMCLNDRDNDRSLWAAADDYDGALGVLEALLAADRPPWRVNRAKGGSGRGRK